MATKPLGSGNFWLYHNLMGTVSYMRSVVDGTVVLWHEAVLTADLESHRYMVIVFKLKYFLLLPCDTNVWFWVRFLREINSGTLFINNAVGYNVIMYLPWFINCFESFSERVPSVFQQWGYLFSKQVCSIYYIACTA